MKKHLLCFVFTGHALFAQAACPSPPPAGLATRFTISSDGLEVTDHKTRLVWARCSVGQVWNGVTCSGDVSPMDHTRAMALGVQVPYAGWRLPNVKELVSLADNGCPTPSIDTTTFPNAPSFNGYWTSTPFAGTTGFAYSVYFADGFARVSVSQRFTGYAVRLVRTGP
jgi:hypothetical protein